MRDTTRLARKLTTEGPLASRLQFGNAEQIAALRTWRAAIEEDATAAEEAEMLAGQEVEWDVTYTVEKTRTVWAASKEAAEQAVHEDELGWVEDILSVERV